MPIYEFRCLECGEIFDIRASIKEKQAGLKPACPNCTSQSVQQMITFGQALLSGKDIPFSSCGPNSGSGCCG